MNTKFLLLIIEVIFFVPVILWLVIRTKSEEKFLRKLKRQGKKIKAKVLEVRSISNFASAKSGGQTFHPYIKYSYTDNIKKIHNKWYTLLSISLLKEGSVEAYRQKLDSLKNSSIKIAYLTEKPNKGVPISEIEPRIERFRNTRYFFIGFIILIIIVSMCLD